MSFLEENYVPLGLHHWSPHLKELFPFTYQNKYCTLKYEESDYERMDTLSDCFQEKHRLSALLQGQTKSHFETWKEEGWGVAQTLYEAKQDLTCKNLRESMYKRAKECNTFKPSVALSVFKYFSAKRILDFSAGWGDRLCAAIAHQAERYLGIDPNSSLQEGYRDIIDKLVPLSFEKDKIESAMSRYEVRDFPFESVHIDEKEMFDLAFTSPPYFDYEIYSQQKGQSILSFPSLSGWLQNFLFVSLAKAWDHLSEDGHMVIHITDRNNLQISAAMNLFILSHLVGSSYQGIISTQGSSKKRIPMWVWKKSKAHSPWDSPKSHEELKLMLENEIRHAQTNYEACANDAQYNRYNRRGGRDSYNNSTADNYFRNRNNYPNQGNTTNYSQGNNSYRG